MEKKLLLQVQDLSKTFIGNKGLEIHALKNINLDIYEGEILALLGPNGAGKTTLASILITLLERSSGNILFRGKSVFESLSEYRSVVGFCPQLSNLYQGLTINDNIFYAGKLYGMSDEDASKRTKELLARYKLEKYKDQFVHSLSGGYKQRASIARSLVHSPKFVLFDEPTVGLDPKIRRELWSEILALKKDGVSIILTTHYLDEAEFLADRVCLISGGEMKFVGTLDILKKESNLDSLEEILCQLEEE